ncbi:MAG TPA: hypothetical protein VFP86_14490 [bacterium]|nr:hypothetical protein [bacterium]
MEGDVDDAIGEDPARSWLADGPVLSTGAVLIDRTNEVVLPSRIRKIVHYPRGEQAPPHENPRPDEMGYLVLLGAVFFEDKRFELEMAAGWRDASGAMIRLGTATTLSAAPALAVTVTNGSLALSTGD